MATPKRASLFGLAFELRNRIFEQVFEDHYVALKLGANIKGNTIPTIDDGVTLKCHQLRAETMSHLQQGIGLRCYVPSAGCPSLNSELFPGKAAHMHLIRRIHVLFQHDYWTIPFDQFPNLEEVRVEAAGTYGALKVSPDNSAKILRRNAEGGIKNLIAAICLNISGLNSYLPVVIRTELSKSNRGFRVIWKDKYASFELATHGKSHVRLDDPRG
jgi:hypothetical protein